jgi:hypothetical protein
MLETLGALRAQDMFDIVIDYPDSAPALQDLALCLAHTNMAAQVGSCSVSKDVINSVRTRLVNLCLQLVRSMLVATTDMKAHVGSCAVYINAQSFAGLSSAKSCAADAHAATAAVSKCICWHLAQQCSPSLPVTYTAMCSYTAITLLTLHSAFAPLLLLLLLPVCCHLQVIAAAAAAACWSCHLRHHPHVRLHNPGNAPAGQER